MILGIKKINVIFLGKFFLLKFFRFKMELVDFVVFFKLFKELLLLNDLLVMNIKFDLNGDKVVLVIIINLCKCGIKVDGFMLMFCFKKIC